MPVEFFDESFEPIDPPPVIIYVVDEDTVAVAGREDLTVREVAHLLHVASHNLMDEWMQRYLKSKEN